MLRRIDFTLAAGTTPLLVRLLCSFEGRRDSRSYLLRLVAAPLPLTFDGPFSVFLLIDEVG